MQAGKSLILLWSLLIAPLATRAGDLEDLAKRGYAVVEETNVDGEFNGCDYDRRITLDNRLIFVCSEYSYSYSYRPDVLILEHIRTHDIKVLIDDDEYDGTLYKR